MRLAPTTEQQEIKDAVRRFASEQITAERLVAWERSPEAVDAETWRQIASLGWFGLGLPTAVGGSGLTLVEVACLLEECARGLVPRPVISALRGGLALAMLDATAVELTAVGRGDAVVALSLDEEHGRDPARYSTQVAQVGERLTLTGQKWYVSEAARASLHIVAAREDTQALTPSSPQAGGVSLLLADGRQATCEALRTFDGDRQAIVTYDRSAVHRRLRPPGQGGAALQWMQRQQVALGLAEMLGVMDAVLSMTVDYVKQREQFGQKLGVFQAVQHQVADMATSLTAARHLAWQAITRVAMNNEEGGELETAAAFVGQACKRLTLTAHHLHGGAGYVVEHPLHYHAERAQALCIRYAPEGQALATIANALLD